MKLPTIKSKKCQKQKNQQKEEKFPQRHIRKESKKSP